MNDFGHRKLIRESKWMRVFQHADNDTEIYESKFLVDDLQISASEVRKIWPVLPLADKVEFALAFGCHTLREGEDKEILEFLMAVGPDEVWTSIAIIAASHPQPNIALEFLLQRIRQCREGCANYFQAIELLRREEAIPLLRERYNEYQRALARRPQEMAGDGPWIDYLQCAKALWTLTHDSTFVDDLKKAPAQFDSYAAYLLREIDEGK